MQRVYPEKFPSLETKRLILRELAPGDRDEVFRNYSDEEIVRYIMEPVKTLEEAEKDLEEMIRDFYRDRRLFWAIESKDGHAFLGTVCYERISPQGCGEIGYDLAKRYWGKGFMQEALGEVIRFGFENLGLKEIEALTMPANEHSIHLLKKFGFEIADSKEEDYRFILDCVRWENLFSARH